MAKLKLAQAEKIVDTALSRSAQTETCSNGCRRAGCGRSRHGFQTRRRRGHRAL